MPTGPRVSVLVAVANGERHLAAALESIARQTLRDFELIVVDDASTDATPDVLAAVADSRLRVVRNEERRGLAGALNRGLEVATGRFVARMDADDIALPRWLERVVARIEAEPRVGLVGAGLVELLPHGRLGAAHVPVPGPAVTRWYANFSASPFFHNTVLFDRELFERHGLRYDESYGESEDYELWTRVLEHAEADSLDEITVLYRIHPAQASTRRGDLQRSLGRTIALRQIGAVAPALSEEERELAWRFGFRQPLDGSELDRAARAYRALYEAFVGGAGYSYAELRPVRELVALELLRRARSGPRASGAVLVRAALELDPAALSHGVSRRARRARAVRRVSEIAGALAAQEARDDDVVRVAAVFPEPTPYRSPLLDRVAAQPEIELTVLYAAQSVVAGRSWDVASAHRAAFLHGRRIPGADRLVRHEYPITPGVVRELRHIDPDVVVVSGWSTFAAQAAIAWCRATGTPYVLVVESHDEGPRPGWRRAVKGAVVPPIVDGAAGVLVAGSLARTSMVARGADSERVRIFANTIDVEDFGARADRLRARRDELRADLGIGPDDVAVLSVARLSPEKRLDDLLRAVARAGSPLVLVLAGDGPERDRLAELGRELGAAPIFVGEVAWEGVVDLYVAADVFALLSERETWGVVVNEAAACGLPLVLSDRVGSAHDLLRSGENGELVAAGDVEAAACALRRLGNDAELRRTQGARSRELAADWGYGPSVEGFLSLVRDAAARRRR